MNYLLAVRSIMNFLEWPKISLMGHSLGGIMCYIFNMLFNKEVDFLICLDGAKPLVHTDKIARIARHVTQFPTYHEHAVDPNEPPNYSLEEIIKKICGPNQNSVKPEYAKYLIERKTAPSKLHQGKNK